MEELFLELLRIVGLGGDAMIGLVDVSPQMNHLAASNKGLGFRVSVMTLTLAVGFGV